MNKLNEVEYTARGFAMVEFKDAYDASCSIQQSSNAGYDALWLGIDDVDPKVMASQASSVGVDTYETTGWVKYPIPEEVLLSSRMHLNREQVEGLVNHLQTWLKEGEL